MKPASAPAIPDWKSAPPAELNAAAWRREFPNRQRHPAHSTERWIRVSCLLLGLAVGAAGPAAHAATTHAVVDYQIDTWGVSDGMPDGSANAMVQTPDGYLWIATFGGLVRFNGAVFTTIHPRNTPGLPSGAIANLHLDQAGRMWLSTFRGIVIRDGDRWTTLGPQQGWPGGYVRSFAEQAGVMCLTSREGGVFRVEGDNLRALPEPPGDKGGSICHVDRTGKIWIEKTGFFGHWDGQRWIESAVAAEVTPNFRGLGTARSDGLWVLSGRTLSWIRDDRITARRRLPEDVGWCSRIYEDRQGVVWLCSTNKGLWRVPPSGLVRQFAAAEGLTSTSILFAFEDREHNLWTGADSDGLIRLKAGTFINHVPPAERESYNVSAVAEDRSGRIIVGTFGRGLAEADGAGRITPLDWAAGVREAVFVQCLLADRGGRIWVGYRKSGLLIRHADASEFRPATDTGGDSIAALFEDSRGRVWIGGEKSVSLYADGAFRPFAAAGTPALVRAFAEDPASGDIWAATPDGLFRHGTGGWREIKDEGGQPILDIQCLRTEADGTLWVGGSRRALQRLRGGRLSPLTDAQGFQVEVVRAIVDDGLGGWWLGSNRGVVRFHRNQLERAADDPTASVDGKVFGLSDGLASLECAANAPSKAMKDRRGRLWFATRNGLAMVEPEKLQRRLEKFEAPVVIEEFRLENRAGQMRFLPVTGGEPVQVTPETREIKITFACLSYVEPEKIRYSFQLEGRDEPDRWHDIKNRGSIYFSPLDPGAYRLLVRAANNDGVQSANVAAMAFVVLPQFWQTVWFRLALAGLVAAGIGVVFQWRMRAVRRRTEVLQRTNLELEQRVQARTAELAARVTDVEALNQELETFSYSVSHDLRAPLRNITGFMELLTRRAGARLDDEDKRFVQTASSEARRMSVLVDELLALSRIGRAKLVLQPVQLTELVAEVRTELQPEMAGRRIAWQIAPLPEVHGDRLLLRQVVANLLGNAVKFTQRCEEAVIEIGTISPTAEEPHLTIFVRDNGAGFNPKYAGKLFGVFQRLHNQRDFEGTGIGLANVKRIIHRHGGRVWAEGLVDKGAVFYFTIPPP